MSAGSVRGSRRCQPQWWCCVEWLVLLTRQYGPSSRTKNTSSALRMGIVEGAGSSEKHRRATDKRMSRAHAHEHVGHPVQGCASTGFCVAPFAYSQHATACTQHNTILTSAPPASSIPATACQLTKSTSTGKALPGGVKCLDHEIKPSHRRRLLHLNTRQRLHNSTAAATAAATCPSSTTGCCPGCRLCCSPNSCKSSSTTALPADARAVGRRSPNRRAASLG